MNGYSPSTRKPYYTKGRPQNLRMRCMDCGGQFHESTQSEKMEAHCFVMRGATPSMYGSHGELHHSWRKAVGSASDPLVFRTISDATDDMRSWVLSIWGPNSNPSVKEWLALQR